MSFGRTCIWWFQYFSLYLYDTSTFCFVFASNTSYIVMVELCMYAIFVDWLHSHAVYWCCKNVKQFCDAYCLRLPTWIKCYNIATFQRALNISSGVSCSIVLFAYLMVLAFCLDFHFSFSNVHSMFQTFTFQTSTFPPCFKRAYFHPTPYIWSISCDHNVSKWLQNVTNPNMSMIIL